MILNQKILLKTANLRWNKLPMYLILNTNLYYQAHMHKMSQLCTNVLLLLPQIMHFLSFGWKYFFTV